jgi:hypothetical protein
MINSENNENKTLTANELTCLLIPSRWGSNQGESEEDMQIEILL